MRRLGLLLLAACTSNAPPPGGFGVNVTVDASQVDHANIFSFAMHVSGDEVYDKTFDVHKPVQSGTVHFQYIPLVRSGSLTFAINAVDDQGQPKGYGASDPVTLVDGKAVSATVVLSAAALADMTVPPDLSSAGKTCLTVVQCNGLACVDGVCCSTACNGVCESCNQAGHKGECLPLAANTDPDSECAVKAGAPDGGAAGGTDGGDADAGTILVIPDGGFITPPACSGTCDGARACAYPGSSTSCGPQFCTDQATYAAFVCDGHGVCGPSFSTCSAFICSSGTCKTQCSAHTDCLPGKYCNVNTNACVDQKANGLPCVSAPECQTGYCVLNTAATASFCCNSSCNDTGMACDNPPGTCTCSGQTCPNGCRLFYLDSDGDGHGTNATATIANGKAVAGCIGMTSVSSGGQTFVPNNDDCDDANNKAHPGQTGWFGNPGDVPLSNGSYDYDCSGSEEYQYPAYPNRHCQLCGLEGPDAAHGNWWWCDLKSVSCGPSGADAAYGGWFNNQYFGFDCGFYCYDAPSGNYYCCPPGRPGSAMQGFTQDVKCSFTAPFETCGYCLQSDSTVYGASAPMQVRLCH